MAQFLPEDITTQRLHLRRPNLADASVIFTAYAQDPEVCRFMIWTPHVSAATTHTFIESCIDDWASDGRMAFIINQHSDDNAVGMIEARLLGTAIGIGYVLARPFWGAGLISEAIAALTETALASFGIYRVQATCDTDNVPSQRPLEKSGFLQEGLLKRYTIHPNLSPEPPACFMYAKFR